MSFTIDPAKLGWMLAPLFVMVVTLSVQTSAVGQNPQFSSFPNQVASGDRTKQIRLDAIRAVAGESRSVAWESVLPSAVSVISTRTTPPLTFPIHVEVHEESGTRNLRAVIPPATPAGEYDLEVTVIRSDGEALPATLHVTVDAVMVPPAALVSRAPVILLNGWQAVCSLNTDSSLAASTGTFGQLASFLQSDGAPVLFFNNCAYGDIPIEKLAAQLNVYIAGLHYTDGTPVTQLDLVTHSMGGLIARAYLSGLQADGSLSPPPNPRVRKLVEIATPNFGSFQAINLGIQLPEMIPGSAFLWNLATWNQRGDDLRGVDALAIIGNAGNYGSSSNASDGVVSLTSASLGFVAADQRTRIVPYCHTDPPSIGMSCTAALGIANVTDTSQLTGGIVRSFLAGTTDWISIGGMPSQDPYLSRYGGVYFEVENGLWQYLKDLNQVMFGTVPLQSGGATGRVFYNEFFYGTDTFHATSGSLGQVTYGPFSEPTGHYAVARAKFGPVISSVSPFLMNASGRTVGSGAPITINGIGFGQQCPTCQVLAGSVPLQVSSWSDQAITVFLPATYNGIVQLAVQIANGLDKINIMAAAPPPSPVITVSPSSLQFSYTIGGTVPPGQPVQVTISGGGAVGWSAISTAAWLSMTPAFSPISSTFTVSVAPVGLAAVTYYDSITISALGAVSKTVSVTLAVTAPLGVAPTVNGIVNGASFAAGAAVAPGSIVSAFGANLASSASGGVAVRLNGTAAFLFDVFPTQINFQIPWELSGQSQASLTVTADGVTSSPATVNLAAFTPGIFAIGQSGQGAVLIASSGEIVAPSGSIPGRAARPVNRGEYITIYCTGLGPVTNQPATGAKASDNPLSVTATPTVTIGSVPAFATDGFFSGLAPTFVGLYQVNVQVPMDSPTGSTVPLVLTIGGATSNTVTIAVQ